MTALRDRLAHSELMFRSILMLVGVSLAVGGRGVASTAGERVRFTAGRRLFEQRLTMGDGLGPQANAFSCAGCHPRRGKQDHRSVVFVSNAILNPAGGRVFRRLRLDAVGSVTERQPPPDAAVRRAPALFALALLESIPGEAIAAIADPTDEDGNGVSGRRPIGRFGWKARFATLRETVAAAFAVELGLTSELFASDSQRPAEPRRPEISIGQIDSVVAFLRSRRPRRLVSSDAMGSEIFVRIGCETCHRSRIDRFVSPYTDVLLHDMGPALADGVEEGNASGSEFRTAPLWGLGTIGPPYLHDGRARSFEEAILAHGGEATGAAEAYRALPPKDKQALVRFLKSI